MAVVLPETMNWSFWHIPFVFGGAILKESNSNLCKLCIM